jgi:hypothetical protein
VSSRLGLLYKLDEVVFQFMANNGHVALLALDRLSRSDVNGQLSSFLYVPEAEIAPPQLEVDILCIKDGDMFLGEAKKEDRLARKGTEEVREIRKYTSLARESGVRKVVFATFAERWSQRTIDNIEREVPDPIEILYLTKGDLVN